APGRLQSSRGSLFGCHSIISGHTDSFRTFGDQSPDLFGIPGGSHVTLVERNAPLVHGPRLRGGLVRECVHIPLVADRLSAQEGAVADQPRHVLGSPPSEAFVLPAVRPPGGWSGHIHARAGARNREVVTLAQRLPQPVLAGSSAAQRP